MLNMGELCFIIGTRNGLRFEPMGTKHNHGSKVAGPSGGQIVQSKHKSVIGEVTLG